METEERPHIWTPDFDTRTIEIDGHDWPLVIVDKYEVNEIGERRFLGSKSHQFATRPRSRPSET